MDTTLWHEHEVYIAIFSGLPKNHHWIFWMWEQWVYSTKCSTKKTKIHSASVEVSSVEYSEVEVSTPESSHLFILWRSLQFQREVSQSFSVLTQDLVSRTSVEECVSKELERQHSLYPNLPTNECSPCLSWCMHVPSVVKVFKDIYKKFLSLVSHIASWRVRKTLRQCCNEMCW